MERITYILLLRALLVAAKFCGVAKAPFELGKWTSNLKHLDAATIENTPVTIGEGQFYVYENTFPGYIIKYINVDNVAQRTCGAIATLKRGGVGSSSVLLILHAAANSEIRSVIDVWGAADLRAAMKPTPLKRKSDFQKTRSKAMFVGVGPFNHN